MHTRRKRAKQTPSEENSKSDQEDRFAAPYVSERTPNRRASCASQDKGAADPDVARGGVEAAHDCGNGRRDDGEV